MFHQVCSNDLINCHIWQKEKQHTFLGNQTSLCECFGIQNWNYLCFGIRNLANFQRDGVGLHLCYMQMFRDGCMDGVSIMIYRYFNNRILFKINKYFNYIPAVKKLYLGFRSASSFRFQISGRFQFEIIRNGGFLPHFLLTLTNRVSTYDKKSKWKLFQPSRWKAPKSFAAA